MRLIVALPQPSHIPTAEQVGLRCVTYRHYDPVSGTVDFDAMLAGVSRDQQALRVHKPHHDHKPRLRGVSTVMNSLDHP